MNMNVTIPLPDRYAAAKFAFDEAAKVLEDLKAQVKALGMPELHGVTCDLTLSLCEQMRIDQKALKQFLSDAQIEACKKPVLMETIRIKPKGIAE